MESILHAQISRRKTLPDLMLQIAKKQKQKIRNWYPSNEPYHIIEDNIAGILGSFHLLVAVCRYCDHPQYYSSHSSPISSGCVFRLDYWSYHILVDRCIELTKCLYEVPMSFCPFLHFYGSFNLCVYLIDRFHTKKKYMRTWAPTNRTHVLIGQPSLHQWYWFIVKTFDWSNLIVRKWVVLLFPEILHQSIMAYWSNHVWCRLITRECEHWAQRRISLRRFFGEFSHSE